VGEAKAIDYPQAAAFSASRVSTLAAMEGSEPDTTERAAIGYGGEEREALEADRELTDRAGRDEWAAGRGSTGRDREALEGERDPDGEERAGAEPEGTERDTTDEWRIAPQQAPATVAELEERIDAALVTAQAAEEAALEIGAAGVEAADQARRAAAMAEQASAAASRAASEASAAAESSAASKAVIDAAPWRSEVRPAPSPVPAGINAAVPAPEPPSRPDYFTPLPPRAAPRRPDPFEERITAFRLRAEKVMIRLQKLEAGFKPGDGPSEVVRLR
jgi:trimeric autotransporter adhesin